MLCEMSSNYWNHITTITQEIFGLLGPCWRGGVSPFIWKLVARASSSFHWGLQSHWSTNTTIRVSKIVKLLPNIFWTRFFCCFALSTMTFFTLHQGQYLNFFFPFHTYYLCTDLWVHPEITITWSSIYNFQN